MDPALDAVYAYMMELFWLLMWGMAIIFVGCLIRGICNHVWHKLSTKLEERRREKYRRQQYLEKQRRNRANVVEIEAEQKKTEYRTAQEIASVLGEGGQVSQIYKIVQAIGNEQSRALLARTWEIERNGGMMVGDGSRRRTVGGIFFHLAYTVGRLPNGKPFRRYGIMKELAQVCSMQGKYEQAELLYQKLLTSNEKQAEWLYRRLLAMSERRYGYRHANTISRLNDLVEFYLERGNYEQAEPLSRRAQADASWLETGHHQAQRALRNYDRILQAIKETKYAGWKSIFRLFDFLFG